MDMTSIQIEIFKQELKQSQEMLNNVYVCPECESGEVAGGYNGW